MLIYRIEDVKGRGPYRGAVCSHPLDGPIVGASTPQRPSPREEFGPFGLICPDTAYAFPTLRALCTWWSREDLLRMDTELCARLFVSTYELDLHTEHSLGDHQVVFCQRAARRVSRQQLNAFLAQGGCCAA